MVHATDDYLRWTSATAEGDLPSARNPGRPQPAQCADAGADEEAEGGWQNTDVEWETVSRRRGEAIEMTRASTHTRKRIDSGS